MILDLPILVETVPKASWQIRSTDDKNLRDVYGEIIWYTPSSHSFRPAL